MNTTDCDYIIIGLGLAGAMLAWQLQERGRRVMVLDAGSTDNASRMAAGIINPVTGRRLVKTAHVDTLLPAAEQTYRRLEHQLRIQCFHPMPMLRLIQSQQDIKQWQRRHDNPTYAAYLKTYHQGETFSHLLDPLGSFAQSCTGYVDMAVLLDALKKCFTEKRILRQCQLSYDGINIHHQWIQVGPYRCRRLVFCEGHMGIHNPWFGWLPFQPAKGEILTLKLKHVPADKIINRKYWLLPRDQGQWKLGATYEWQWQSAGPSDQGKHRLLEGLQQILQAPEYRVTGHQAGIRAGTTDSQPFLGTHPEEPRLAVFNGFGSKGVIKIPYYASCLAEHLETGKALPADVAIDRFTDAS